MAHSAVVDRSVEDAAVWETVVSAVAETTGKDPLTMDPLYDAVDPDALEALFGDVSVDRAPQKLTFTYCGCDVEVTDDGVVQVEATERTKTTGGIA